MIERAEGALRVKGPLTIDTATATLAQMREAWPAVGFAGELAVDLRDAAPHDSAAVSLMLAWQRAARERGFAIRFDNVPAGVVTLAVLYGVDAMLGLVAAPHG